MIDSFVEESLVLELPPAVDEELGLGMDVELEELPGESETVGLDDGVVLDMGGSEIDAGDELSWLDAGDEADDLEIGAQVEEHGEGWLDDRPMALDVGFQPETGEQGSALDSGAEGLDEPLQSAEAGDDGVDLPPLPVGSDDDGDLDLGGR